MTETKRGRPRRYDFVPPAGVPDRGAGAFLAALDELSERVYDQISDLPVEAPLGIRVRLDPGEVKG